MSSEPGVNSASGILQGWSRGLLWISGLWIAPLWWGLRSVLPGSLFDTILIAAVALALVPLPALVFLRRRHNQALFQLQQAKEDAEQLKLQLDSVRNRTARLREELSAADQQARLSHQLTLLGQFTAGFMHEFNNPLAIVTSRIEVLLEERKEDAELCGDLQQMLRETRYMGKIVGTLLQALRRERGAGKRSRPRFRPRLWKRPFPFTITPTPSNCSFSQSVTLLYNLYHQSDGSQRGIDK